MAKALATLARCARKELTLTLLSPTWLSANGRTWPEKKAERPDKPR